MGHWSRRSILVVEVAAAIISQNGRYLITKRNHDVMFGGLWEFPGGKRLPDETLEDCLRREMKEELGVDVTVQDLFCEAIYPYSHSPVALYFYNCSIQGGEIKPIGCQNFRWVTPEELLAARPELAARVTLLGRVFGEALDPVMRGAMAFVL
ncbi:MAG: (deoxy)nucleoside triphosphate pyrophosphohydrolase, partial [Nitrospira sp.]|nr:(deoxy)nucleoside triphosphate pyrophosphohydrolase [Nitrospira sp.]